LQPDSAKTARKEIRNANGNFMHRRFFNDI
jgi:hypothetical protein